MWKNSKDLFDHALRELQVAVKEKKVQVEIILSEAFPNDTNKVREYCDRFELKKITESIREQFKNYDVRSVVESKGHLKCIITFQKGPCVRAYPLVWTLTLREK